MRFVLKFAVPVWAHGITASQVTHIERVQKTVCAAERYPEYMRAFLLLNLKPKKNRRKDLCVKFAKDCFKSNTYNDWFVGRIRDQGNIQT